jgi:hypothetical protein
MATKDWKKTSEEYYKTQWENKEGDIVKIQEIFVNNEPNQWEVRYGKNHPYLINLNLLQIFKTKSQALSFARQYMRTH